MAEFKELIQVFNRMCRYYEDKIEHPGLGNDPCEFCPLNKVSEKWDTDCLSLMQKRPEIFERVVTEWGEKHPKSQFPTWVELMVASGALPKDYNVNMLLDTIRLEIPDGLASKINLHNTDV